MKEESCNLVFSLNKKTQNNKATKVSLLFLERTKRTLLNRARLSDMFLIFTFDIELMIFCFEKVTCVRNQMEKRHTSFDSVSNLNRLYRKEENHIIKEYSYYFKLENKNKNEFVFTINYMFNSFTSCLSNRR